MRQYYRFWQVVKKTVLILFFLLPGLHVRSQDGAIGNYHARVWATEDGLPQNSVNDIVQTGDGYLWLATNDGLVRFDGVNFTIFNSGNFPQLKNNRISDLMVSKDDSLWVGTEGGGVTIMRQNGVHSRYTTKHGFDSDYVGQVFEDSSGMIWVINNNKLSYLKNGTFHPFTTADGLSDDRVQLIAEDSRRNLWISTFDGMLHRFRQGKISSYRINDKDENARIFCMCEDREGTVWFGATHGIGRFKNETYILLPAYPDMVVNILIEDLEGNIWGGSFRNGWFYVKNGRVKPYLQHGMQDMAISSGMVDREGNIWTGTMANGLIRLRKSDFTIYTEEHGVPFNQILSIHQDKHGTVFVGTNGRGAAYFRDGVFKRYNPVAGGHIWSIFTDSKGNGWFGTWGGGVRRVRGDEVKSFTTKDGLASDIVRAIYEDSRGNIWIGTAYSGVSVYRDGAFTNYGKEQGFDGETVIAFMEDSNGNLWIGTSGTGLYCFKDGAFTNYRKEDGLSHNSVREIHEDENGALWLGTYGGGLNRFKDGKFIAITEDQGLFNNVVSSILVDDRGFFWMTCNKGVYRAAKKELDNVADGKSDAVNCIYYNKDDGMLNAECNGGFQPSACKTADGKLWIPTIQGIVVFDANDVKLNLSPPPVEIEKIVVNDKIYDPRYFFQLPPGSGKMEFHYTGLSFQVPERVRFQYMLEGAKERWNDIGARRTVYYNRLSPGRYTFRVRACNNHNIWNETGAAVSFYLTPYFYQTGWFYLLCGMLVLALGWAGVRWRVRRLNKRKKELEELVSQRTEQLQTANRYKNEFLARMSHEIRTPMNSIIGFSQMLLESGLKPEQADFAGTISRSGESLITIIDDILDISKMEAGKLTFESRDFNPAVEAADVCKMVKPRLEEKKVDILCHIGEGVPRWVNHDSGRFRQVLVNLMGNAVKFTQQGEIELSIAMVERHMNRVKLRTTVRDTGIGISPDKLGSVFEMFHQADGSITRKFGGTGLGLAISKHIALQMGGDLTVESTPGEGSAFHFFAWMDIAEAPVESVLPGTDGVPAKPPQTGGSPVRVLLAEDNAINRKLAYYMLTRAGYQLDMVENGREAVKKYLSQPESYDIILMDIQMPEMDGRAATRKIREEGFTEIPIVAMTAESMKGDREKCLEAGMNDFISKPIRKETVLAVLSNAWRKKES